MRNSKNSNESSFESKILEWIEKNISLLLLLGVTILSLIIRSSDMDYESGDYLLFLSDWYDDIKSRGGILALGKRVGNYNAPYQLLIAIMTYMPVNKVHAYKIFSIIFDYVLAITSGIIVRNSINKETNTNAKEGLLYVIKDYTFIVPYSFVLLTPTVIINSSMWGQSDSIYSAFAIISLYFLYKRKNVIAFMMLGISFSFKLQAIFILPIFIIIYFKEKKIRLYQFLIIPLMNIIMSSISIIQGMSIKDIFGIYFEQAGTYKRISLNYPSFWNFLGEDYDNLSGIAIWLTIFLLAIELVYIVVKKVDMQNYENFISSTIIIIWTCLSFLPSMHERYGYILEILLLIQIFTRYFSKDIQLFKISIINFIVMQCIILACYAKCLIGNYFDMYIITSIYFALYILYIYRYIKKFSFEKVNE